MSDTLHRIIFLVKKGEVRFSLHGYEELAEDDIFAKDIVNGVENSIIVEDYPNYYKGPCVLVLQYDNGGKPIHVVWGIPKDCDSPAVVVTAYRPDSDCWDDDFLRRKK